MASATTTMVAQTPPKTPLAKISNNASITQTPSPGRWQHPRMAEIYRRRKAAIFDMSNARRIAYNAGALVGTIVGPGQVQEHLPFLTDTISWATRFLGWYNWIPMLLLRILLIYNIVNALMPLFREPDSLADIPLSPSQRVLLGLDPASGNPATPKTLYVTPPRYHKSTPRGQSPANGSNSSGLRGSQRKDGMSPSASPLWAKAVAPEGRRNSLGIESPIGGNSTPVRESFGESGYIPSTPSPSRGNVSGLTLNSRWLYERRSSSGTRR